MNAYINRVNKFEITIGGKVHENFHKVEEWEGMIKFSNGRETVIVEKSSNEFSDIFRDIFGKDSDSSSTGFYVVKMSPKLIPKDEKNDS